MAASAIVILKKRLDIRIKIEVILSDLFNKNIHLAEEGGYIKPKVQNIGDGKEYRLKEDECHGMKEIISLLTFLYNEDYQCIIFDEPELHLHPQFQSFFMNEIRKIAGDPNKGFGNKLFFIITHSPYFIDIRNLDDLQHILVCHNHQMPTYIQADDLNEQDKYVLKKFLPRFNTHHKQFFFSPNPVFVEGYTDQQIISLLFEKIGLNIAASGTSIVDVGGKDELAVFYKLCTLLNINCRIIADYDALFRGKLREFLCANENVKASFGEKGFGFDVSRCIGEIESLLIKIGDVLHSTTSNTQCIQKIVSILQQLYTDKHNNKASINDVILLSIYRFEEQICEVEPNLKTDIKSLLTKHKLYLECLKSSNVFIIPNGELEHFFKATSIDYLNITKKDVLFTAERDEILAIDEKEVLEERYKDILPLLIESVPYIKVDTLKHAKFTIIDWIQNVQNAINRGEIRDIQSLRTNVRVNYSTYSQILECKDDGFILNPDNTFSCTIYLKSSVVGEEKQIIFSDKTTPRNFKIE
ncbi:MAG: AAA family ATPase [Paludibacteraceae bacterium]|nr:AAA family ATPase [Paludibacteraceae bacterium]